MTCGERDRDRGAERNADRDRGRHADRARGRTAPLIVIPTPLTYNIYRVINIENNYCHNHIDIIKAKVSIYYSFHSQTGGSILIKLSVVVVDALD